MSKNITVITTRYEGDEFPEADHWDEFLAARLAADYGATVDVSYGRATRVSGDVDAELADEIRSRVQVDLWDEFCSHGYKAYTAAGSEVR